MIIKFSSHIFYREAAKREGVLAEALWWQRIDLILQILKADFSGIALDFCRYSRVVELVEDNHIYLVFALKAVAALLDRSRNSKSRHLL